MRPNYKDLNISKKGYKALDADEFIEDFSWILADEEICNQKVEIKVTLTERDNYYATLYAIMTDNSKRGYIAKAIHELNKKIAYTARLSEKQKKENLKKLTKYRTKSLFDN